MQIPGVLEFQGILNGGVEMANWKNKLLLIEL